MADLGQVLATSRLDQTLFVMGWVLFVVSLAASFPLTAAAAVGVAGASGALAGLALADFALAVPQAAMTYLDEREQDWAAVSGSFHPAARIAVRSPFGRTGLAAAAALLAGLAFVSSGTRFLRRCGRQNRRRRLSHQQSPPVAARSPRRGYHLGGPATEPGSAKEHVGFRPSRGGTNAHCRPGNRCAKSRVCQRSCNPP